MRVVKDIFKIQPLQMDTVELAPNTAIQGSIGKVVDVVGTAFAAKVTLAANALPMQDGNYEIVVVKAGATGTGSYKVVNIDSGFESAETLTSATPNTQLIAGVSITVQDTTGTNPGDKVTFSVIGDQTYIIPGTVVGKIASGSNQGKWRAVRSTDSLSDFTQFRVAAGFQETDKSKTVLPIGYESNLSNVFTLDVVVYGQIIESAVKAINLDAVADLKTKMPFYAWL